MKKDTLRNYREDVLNFIDYHRSNLLGFGGVIGLSALLGGVIYAGNDSQRPNAQPAATAGTAGTVAEASLPTDRVYIPLPTSDFTVPTVVSPETIVVPMTDAATSSVVLAPRATNAPSDSVTSLGPVDTAAPVDSGVDSTLPLVAEPVTTLSQEPTSTNEATTSVLTTVLPSTSFAPTTTAPPAPKQNCYFPLGSQANGIQVTKGHATLGHDNDTISFNSGGLIDLSKQFSESSAAYNQSPTDASTWANWANSLLLRPDSIVVIYNDLPGSGETYTC